VCAGDLVCCGQQGDNPVRIFAARDEILWRHAAMVEVGLSETGGGITGALGKAAWRVVPDPMLGFITSRLCLGWSRGDARGSPRLFRRKTGSLAIETPRLPGRSAVCSAA